MTGPLPVREFTSAEEMRSTYRELHRKCFFPRAEPVMPRPTPRAVRPAQADLYAGAPRPIQVRAAFAVYPATHFLTSAQAIKGCPISGADALRIASAVSGWSEQAIRSMRRDSDLVRARHIAFWLATKVGDLSFPEAGRRFGGRDHSTVLYGCGRVEAVIRHLNLSLPADPVFAARRLWEAEWPPANTLNVKRRRAL